MEGIKNFLNFVNDNWTTIVVIIGLAIAVVQKVINFWGKSTDQKVEIAKAQIKEIILKLISDAEMDYEDWNKAGSLKRAQVIENVFLQFPILSKVAKQDEVMAWLDEMIGNSLKTMRDVFDRNETEKIED